MRGQRSSASSAAIRGYNERIVHCVKFGRDLPGLDRIPWKGEIGKRVYENVSKDAWKMWLEHSKMVMNEYRLNPLDPNSQKIMEEQMESFSSAKAPNSPKATSPKEERATAQVLSRWAYLASPPSPDVLLRKRQSFKKTEQQLATQVPFRIRRRLAGSFDFSLLRFHLAVAIFPVAGCSTGNRGENRKFILRCVSRNAVSTSAAESPRAKINPK